MDNDELIHPYIMEALQEARAGDPDALAWLESDCISWELIDPNAAILAWHEMVKPIKKTRKYENSTNNGISAAISASRTARRKPASTTRRNRTGNTRTGATR